MTECYGNCFILNGEVIPSGEFDNSMVYEGESVYEVVRTREGVPYFFPDHYKRLESSVNMQGRDQLADYTLLKRAVMLLTGMEYYNEVNLKVVFNYNGGRSNWLLYFIGSSYPGPDEYKNGVKAILFHAERDNPGSKVLNHSLRMEINQRLNAENGYEALLVNKNNLITEGSRSNIFFIRNRMLCTAPDEVVLGGITRKYILEICSEEGLDLMMKCVSVNEIHQYDAVIMTGTSPAVLPFSQVGDIKFGVNHKLISFLRERYSKKAEQSRLDFLRREE